mgnify:CR=1 FL=1
MYKVTVPQQCGCFRRAGKEALSVFDDKDVALMEATEMVTNMNENFCKKHKFNKIIRNNSFRSSKWVYTHLKTFKYKVYKKINHDDLKRDGEYLKSATDLALMYPMLEMSNGRFKCVQNVFYKYNRDHPESNNKIKKKLSTQSENALWVRNQKKYNNTF